MFGWLLKILGIKKVEPPRDDKPRAVQAQKQDSPQPASTDPIAEPVVEEAGLDRLSAVDCDFLKMLLSGGGHTDLQHFPPHERAFLALLMRKANSAELEIPMLPEAAVKIRKLMRNPEVNISQFVDVFKNDPSLSAEILKVANSTFYGFATKTHDIGQAVMRVGYNQVRSVVMMFSVKSKVLHGGQYGAESELIADLALATARACGALSHELGMSGEEAFTRGLLTHLDFFIILGVAAEFNASHKETQVTREMLAEAVGRVGPVITNLIEKKWGLENLGYAPAVAEIEGASQPIREKLNGIGLAVVETWAGRQITAQVQGIPAARLSEASLGAVGTAA